jgi:REP element-mobilizing transposase RayT
MPQSLSAVYIHLVYSTKERRPFLKDETIRLSTHRYLGGISKKLGCAPIIVGGVDDHVHLLARLGRIITQAEWVKELKRVSSLWLKKEYRIRQLEWQGGYAAFSVSQSDLEQVTKYIANQAEHHKKTSFQDELRLLLQEHDVVWDERYIWD